MRGLLLALCIWVEDALNEDALGEKTAPHFSLGMPDMTLKVIGAGLGRTGTHSAQLALNQLGFPCYHMVEVILNKDNKTHLDFWRKVAIVPRARGTIGIRCSRNTLQPSTFPAAASGAN